MTDLTYESDESWDKLIAGLRKGDQEACTEFWSSYGALLESVAQRQLSQAVQRRVGSDDIVQSACRTFFRRVGEGQFDLPDADALWRLICSITLTKARRTARDQRRQKRNLDQEQYIDTISEEAKPGMEPADNRTPFDEVEIADQMQFLLSGLGEQECLILDLKLQQFTNDEIAEKLKCSERTVRRTIKRLQEKWLKMADE